MIIMKKSRPLTDIEYLLTDTDYVAYKTDLAGHITYVSDDFIRISEYTKEESIGSAHSLIRHPDIPEAVFVDLWQTVTANRTWVGLIKSHCKNGGFYWAVAHVIPFYERDRVVGCLVVYKKPSLEQIKEAISTYHLLQLPLLRKLSIQYGTFYKARFLPRLLFLKQCTLYARFVIATALILITLSIVGFLGLHGIKQGNDSLLEIYNDRILPMNQLSSIQRLILTNQILVRAADLNPVLLDQVEDNVKKTNQLWADYLRTALTAEERLLAAQLTEHRAHYLADELQPILAALRKQDNTQLAQLLSRNRYNLYLAVVDDIDKLLQMQTQVTHQIHEQAIHRYIEIRNFILEVIVVFFLLLIYRAIKIRRLITGPLTTVIKHLKQLAQGQFNETIEVDYLPEFNQIFTAIKILQIQLGFAIFEKQQSANETLSIKVGLDFASTGIMIADNARTLIYANNSVMNLLRFAEAGIQKQLPHFSMNTLIGSNIDQFHRQPSYQAAMLANLSGPVVVPIMIGERSLVLTAIPIINEQGEHLGTVAEWTDRTSEQSIERDITGILEQVLQGHFNVRINLADKSGFLKALSCQINTLFDSTERYVLKLTEIEHSLLESEFRWKFALEGAGDGVWDWNIETDRAIYSSRWKTMLGYSDKDILPTHEEWLMRIHPDDQAMVTGTMQDYLQGTVGTYRVEYRLKCKEGHYKWILGRGMAVSHDQQGRPLRMIGTHTDLTKAKETELELQKAKDTAEALVLTKAQFLANMSHEIRTPMSSVISFSELALLKEMPDDIRDYLTKINTSSKSLLNILNDILDLSKIEANGLKMNPVLFDLDELHEGLFNLFVTTIEHKGLSFPITLDSNVPRQLVGDELRIKQVLINLLGNAIKFTEKGSVSLDIRLLATETSQVRLLFAVTDSGIGISVKDQAKLFKTFSQVDETITRRFGGTGLGLALSQELVELMGGQFTVVSTPDVGSCFSFELPFSVPSLSDVDSAEKSAVTLSSALSSVGLQLADMRILVVEDNFFNQQIVKEILQLSGVNVELANNGVEALAILAERSFDAVLMDIHMPVMDGFEATQHIRKLPEFAELPVLALTAGVTEEEYEQCKACGMTDFVSKPIERAKLLSTLAKWVKPRNTGL